MDNFNRFGLLIRNHREKVGFTQEELAEHLYVSDKAVSKWETGNSVPEITRLKDIADVLNVSEFEMLDSILNSDEDNFCVEIPYVYEYSPLKKEDFADEQHYNMLKTLEQIFTDTDDNNRYNCTIMLTKSEFSLYKYLCLLNPDYSISEFLENFVYPKCLNKLREYVN